MNQQPQVIYVQKERNGCLWAFAAIGLLAIALFLLALWGTVRVVEDVNQVPYVLDTAVQTLAAPEMKVEPGVIILSTSTPFATATTAPMPTSTAVQVFNNRGLPSMGPYTLDQVQQCRAIVQNGQIDTLPSPQRELCEMYAEK